MGARGPKSSSHNILEMQGNNEKRPSPPRGMSVAARKLWNEIIQREKSSHFKAGDLPLLRMYCEAEAMNLRATAAILEQGEVLVITKAEISADGKTVVHKVTSSRTNPWVEVFKTSCHSASQLATKLRLCRNARVSGWKEGGEKETPKSKRGNLMFGGNKN